MKQKSISLSVERSTSDWNRKYPWQGTTIPDKRRLGAEFAIGVCLYQYVGTRKAYRVEAYTVCAHTCPTPTPPHTDCHWYCIIPRASTPTLPPSITFNTLPSLPYRSMVFPFFSDCMYTLLASIVAGIYLFFITLPSLPSFRLWEEGPAFPDSPAMLGDSSL